MKKMIHKNNINMEIKATNIDTVIIATLFYCINIHIFLLFPLFCITPIFPLFSYMFYEVYLKNPIYKAVSNPIPRTESK